MKKINAPPGALKTCVGVDSVHMQIKGINWSDVVRFCQERGLAYKLRERTEYGKRWTIFLAGGQPISVAYHTSSKSMTFEVGGLMNYTTHLCEQHIFLQQLVQDFSEHTINIPSIDMAVDIKEPVNRLTIEDSAPLRSTNEVNETTYYNRSNGSVLCVYNKALQMGLFSTTLSRLEIRFPRHLMRRWKLQDFMDNRKSLERLARKVESVYREEVVLTTIDKKHRLKLDLGDTVTTLEAFVAFLQGDKPPAVKDHFKVAQAVQYRDRFFCWLSHHSIKDIADVDKFVKGRKAEMLEELGFDHKTFNKAVKFYKGIPNFKIPV